MSGVTIEVCSAPDIHKANDAKLMLEGGQKRKISNVFVDVDSAAGTTNETETQHLTIGSGHPTNSPHQLAVPVFEGNSICLALPLLNQIPYDSLIIKSFVIR